jgi:DNA-binding protein HU-beta
LVISTKQAILHQFDLVLIDFDIYNRLRRFPARGSGTVIHKTEDLFMNRQELVDAMAAKAGISKAAADAAVKAFIETVGDELQNGGKVQLVGFGTFETSQRAARTGRNPQTGAATKIAACTAPKFKAGKALKDQVNSSKKSKK